MLRFLLLSFVAAVFALGQPPAGTVTLTPDPGDAKSCTGPGALGPPWYLKNSGNRDWAADYRIETTVAGRTTSTNAGRVVGGGQKVFIGCSGTAGAGASSIRYVLLSVH